jgi:hypothetical protein
MAAKRAGSVLPKPPGVDPGWATKIAKAKEAREEGRKMREGKPVVFPTSRETCADSHR